MRAGRLVELMLLLQRRGRLTAGELALELEVSPRTVLRDIEALSGAGVPVYAVRGREGGFELLDGFETDLSTSGWRSPGPNRRRVGLRVSPEGRRRAALLGRHLRARRTPKWPEPADRPGWVEATILVESLEDARLFLLQLGAEVEVVTPGELRDRMRETGRAMADLHS